MAHIQPHPTLVPDFIVLNGRQMPIHGSSPCCIYTASTAVCLLDKAKPEASCRNVRAATRRQASDLDPSPASLLPLPRGVTLVILVCGVDGQTHTNTNTVEGV
jgi:hypothetical protein